MKLVVLCKAELRHNHRMMVMTQMKNSNETFDPITAIYDMCTYEIYADCRYVAVSEAIISESQ